MSRLSIEGPLPRLLASYEEPMPSGYRLGLPPQESTSLFVEGSRSVKNRGLMFLVMYCATACVFLNQFKVVPLMPTLMEMLGVTSAEAS